MILELLKNTDLSFLTQLATPELFKVVPFTELLGIGQSLLARSRGEEHARATCERISPLCIAAGIQCRAPGDFVGLSPESGPMSREEGGKILRAYFAQILHSDQWFLDFRNKGFRANPSGELDWMPGPYTFAPSAPFIESVRALYRGFYVGETPRFEEALEKLGLAPARATLLEHFGGGDQRSVGFEIRTFQKTFAKVFTDCADGRSRLHPEFAVLGIMLLTLYETLEAIGEPLDVRAAFESANSFGPPD